MSPPTSLVFGLICWLSAVFVADNAHAAFGDLVAHYSFPASSLVMSPTQPLMYATIPSQNSIAIINTNTLAVESTVFVGSGPVNLAFSPDGSKAYIANSTSNFVVVFDTQTRTVTNSFGLLEHPQDVLFGTLNRLWVLGESQIFQINATTDASTGPSITDAFVYGGSLEISPDQNTLYYGDYGVSPSTMYKYDVSGTSPVQLLKTPFGTVGSNGEDLTLSHSGSFICYTTGSGQNTYQIAKFRTSDFATLGSFNTGPYPQATAFSPDDLVVYASVHTAAGIKVFDANTFLSLGTISGPEVATKLAVDSTGRYLFAGYTAYYGDFMGTRVYDTGRVAATRTLTMQVSPSGEGTTNPPIGTKNEPQNSAVPIQAIPNWGYAFTNWTGSVANPTNTSTTVTMTQAQTITANFRRSSPPDFNGDDKSDIIWQDNSTGARSIWFMNGITYAGGVSLPTVPVQWQIVGTGDFNGDGKVDIVWENTSTGDCSVWFMNGTTYAGGVNFTKVPPEWRIVAIGDFNHDGKPDIVWQNIANGVCSIWFMDGTNYAGGVNFATVPTDWRIVGAADFNGDGQPDLLWENTSTGDRAIWFMDGMRIGGVNFTNVPPQWHIAGTGDFTGDGKADILWENTFTGDRSIWFMNGPNYAGGISLPTIPTNWDIRNH